MWLERELRGERPNSLTKRALQLLDVVASDEVAISSVTASELLHGVHRADSRHRPGRQGFVELILDRCPCVPFDLRIARIHAAIWADMQAKGTSAGAHDLMIGATAVSLGWPVATLNPRHFAAIPGLAVTRPKTDRGS